MQSRKVISRIDAELAATARVLETLNRREDALRIKRTLNYVAYLVLEDAEEGGNGVDLETLRNCYADEATAQGLNSTAFVDFRAELIHALKQGWIHYTGADTANKPGAVFHVTPRLGIRLALPGYAQEGGKSNALLATMIL